MNIVRFILLIVHTSLELFTFFFTFIFSVAEMDCSGKFETKVTVVGNFVHYTGDRKVVEGFLRNVNTHYPGVKVIVGISSSWWDVLGSWTSTFPKDVKTKSFSSK